MGDLDIYRSTFDKAKKEWSEPVNLGYPINSVENDIYFVLTADEKFAYVSSLRKENLGEQDIYKIDMQKWKPVYLDQPEYAEVFAEASKATAPAATATQSTFASPTPPATTQPAATTPVTTATTSSVPQPSYRPVKIKWTVTDENNKPLQTDVRVVSSSDSVVNYHIVVTSSNFPTNPQVNVGYIMNVYFAHDGVDPISYEGIRNLLVMMKNSPTMKLEISGHTDSKGPDSYNQSLSLRRAQSVRNILIKGGAGADRVTAVGYGESKPMETNDSMEGRRMNRRIEFRILEP
jgi:outer membrane protein OmpA-like peptidoglycan-associated protein